MATPRRPQIEQMLVFDSTTGLSEAARPAATTKGTHGTNGRNGRNGTDGTMARTRGHGQVAEQPRRANALPKKVIAGLRPAKKSRLQATIKSTLRP